MPDRAARRLIMAQRPSASQVASLRQWQAKGRQLRKGEKSIKVFEYAEKKITDDADKERHQANRRRR